MKNTQKKVEDRREGKNLIKVAEMKKNC